MEVKVAVAAVAVVPPAGAEEEEVAAAGAEVEAGEVGCTSAPAWRWTGGR